MDPRHRRCAELLALGLDQREAGAAIVPPVKPRQVRQWRSDIPGFAEIADGAPAQLPDPHAPDVDLGIDLDTAEDRVLNALLSSNKEEIRLRAATVLRSHRVAAPGTDASEQCLQVFFGPACPSNHLCECPDCNVKRNAALEAAKQDEREEYRHATRRELSPV